MLKIKKGGLAVEELPGILFVMFVAVIVIFAFYIIIAFNQSHKQKQVEASFGNLNANYNLNYFLRLQLEDNKNIIDLISDAYLKKEYEQLKTLSSNFFGDIYYTKSLRYDILIDGKSMNSESFIIEASSTIPIPIITKESQKVELVVGKSGLPVSP